MSKPIEHKPYQTDLEYLSDEIEYILCRARRAAAERDTPEERQASKDFRGKETQLRSRIDHRLRATRDEDPHRLGIDLLCNGHQLNDFERTVLITASLPVLGGETAEEHLLGITPRFSPAVVCPEAVWELLQFTGEERLKSLTTFLSNSKLVKNGLIKLGHKVPVPGDVGGVSIDITWSALAVITGMPKLAEAERAEEETGGR